MSHSSLAVANEFLKRAFAEGKQLTHMHLQKLVYIAHGWHLALHNEPLVDEQFEAWDFGPVAPDLYQALKRYGSRHVTRLVRHGDETPFPDDDGDTATARLDASEIAVIDQIWDEFKTFEAFQLSALTHKDRSPWHQYFQKGLKNQPISNNSIQTYFSELADAPD